jgi:hypothetical protein
VLVAEEIHHRECKIVENIGRRHRRIELDRIEQDRLALDHGDVTQLQVAVAMTDKSFLATRTAG